MSNSKPISIVVATERDAAERAARDITAKTGIPARVCVHKAKFVDWYYAAINAEHGDDLHRAAYRAAWPNYDFEADIQRGQSNPFTSRALVGETL